MLLRFSVEWNTNSKTCHEAQLVLNQVLRIHTPDELLGLPNIKPILEGLLPYSGKFSTAYAPAYRIRGSLSVVLIIRITSVTVLTIIIIVDMYKQILQSS